MKLTREILEPKTCIGIRNTCTCLRRKETNGERSIQHHNLTQPREIPQCKPAEQDKETDDRTEGYRHISETVQLGVPNLIDLKSN